MSKLIILSVIAVSVSAQFVSDSRPAARASPGVSRGQLAANLDYAEEGLRFNPAHDGPGHREVGGFQNGNFAPSDGKLRTNLDSSPLVKESGQNYQPRADGAYVVEEGAAFRRSDNHDVHSSLGRNVDVSRAALDYNNSDEESNIEQRSRQSSGNNDRVPNSDHTTVVDRKVNSQRNKDAEAKEREMNNQISKLIFDESTQEVTTKNNPKTTEDNELPSRKNLGKQGEMWVWTDADGKKNATAPVPSVDDRAAFVGDGCPTGQVKFNKVCVDVDE